MRLFVAIDLPEETKQRLAAMCAGVPGAKWVGIDQMHVTLRFLGELDGARVRDVVESLAGVRAPAFEIGLHGIGTFGTGNRVRVLWAGVEAGPELGQLHGRVERAVRGAGVEPEGRKFHAHVTLARFKGASPNLAQYLSYHEPFRAGPFTATEFVLYSSHLNSRAAIYRAEARYPLAAAGVAEGMEEADAMEDLVEVDEAAAWFSSRSGAG